MIEENCLSSVYVVGGRQKADAGEKEEWFRFEQGLILKVDLATGAVEKALEYVSPPEARPDGEYSCLFKSGTVVDEKLYVCTQTEVLVYSLPDFSLQAYISLPCFNDLHHVFPTKSQTLLIANTGLDMVLEVDLAGQVLREWGALGQDPWLKFSREIDYRKIPTTKPHESHPNYVVEVDDEIWCTRFAQKDAVCLTRPEKTIGIEVERPHDGIFEFGKFFYTTVNGTVVIADRGTTKVDRVVNLNQLSDSNLPLGWCRGLSLLSNSQALVGFSRLRPTKIRQNIRWVTYHLGLSGTPKLLPTRISLFDFSNDTLLREVNLEQHGMAAIFSIHPWSAD